MPGVVNPTNPTPGTATRWQGLLHRTLRGFVARTVAEFNVAQIGAAAWNRMGGKMFYVQTEPGQARVCTSEPRSAVLGPRPTLPPPTGPLLGSRYGEEGFRYATLLAKVMIGGPTLVSRGYVVEQASHVVRAERDGWRKNDYLANLDANVDSGRGGSKAVDRLGANGKNLTGRANGPGSAARP